jgi:hypothetical protein
MCVPTKTAFLETGDYSIEGYESCISVERKSKADAFNTISQGRQRFERELDRLNGMPFAAIVLEAEWSEILSDPPRHSDLSPKIVFRSVVAWQQRFTRVHWWTVCGRRMGEVVTLRMLERFWKEQQRKG